MNFLTEGNQGNEAMKFCHDLFFKLRNDSSGSSQPPALCSLRFLL